MQAKHTSTMQRATAAARTSSSTALRCSPPVAAYRSHAANVTSMKQRQGQQQQQPRIAVLRCAATEDASSGERARLLAASRVCGGGRLCIACAPQRRR